MGNSKRLGNMLGKDKLGSMLGNLKWLGSMLGNVYLGNMMGNLKRMGSMLGNLELGQMLGRRISWDSSKYPMSRVMLIHQWDLQLGVDQLVLLSCHR